MKTKRILFMLFFLTSFVCFLVSQNDDHQDKYNGEELYNSYIKIEGDSLLLNVYGSNVVIFETLDPQTKYTPAIMYRSSSDNPDVIRKVKSTDTRYVTQTDSFIVMTQLEQVFPRGRVTYYTFVQATDTMELQCIVYDPYSYQYYKNLEFKKGSYIFCTNPDLKKKTALKNILHDDALSHIGTYNYDENNRYVKKPLLDCPFVFVDLQDTTQTVWRKVDQFDP